MFFRLFPFISSLAFVGIVLFTLFFFSYSHFWVILSFLGILIFFLLRKSTGKFSNSLIPLLLIAGSLPVLSLMETVIVRYVLVGCLSFLLYLELLTRGRLKDHPQDKNAIPILNITNFIVFFIWANLIFASYIYFSEIIFPFWAMILIAALISFVVAKDILKHVFYSQKEAGVSKTEINLASAVVALSISEIAWALAFFPLRYRSSAVILLCAFYLAFVSVMAFLTKKEKRGKLAKDIVIALIAIVIVLVTSKWRYY